MCVTSNSLDNEICLAETKSVPDVEHTKCSITRIRSIKEVK